MDIFEVLVMLIAVAVVAVVIATFLILMQTLMTTYRNHKARQQLLQNTAAAIKANKPIAPAMTAPPANAAWASHQTQAPQPQNQQNQQNQDPQSASRHQGPQTSVQSPGTDDLAFPGKSLLSPKERILYQELCQMIPRRMTVLCKVRASDVIHPGASLAHAEMYAATTSIATHQLDFVLCDQQDFRVVCIIAMKEQGQRSMLQRLHNNMLQLGAESVSLPFLRVDCDKADALENIRQQLQKICQFQPVLDRTASIRFQY